MELSFIIVTYKRNHILKLCLESIYQQDDLPKPFEVVVIDNDGNAEIPHPPDESIIVRLEQAPDNLGAAAGRNYGMSLAQGDFWIFLDDDAHFRDTVTASLILQLLRDNPTCGAVAGRGFAPDGDAQAGLLPYANKIYAQSLTDTTEAPYYYGFVHALRAEVIQKIGGYPERFFIMMEEVDLSYRIINAGYTILYHPDVTVTHHHAQEGRATIGDNYWYRNTLNKMQLGWRLLPFPYPLTTMFVWSCATLWYSRNPMLLWRIWREFFHMLPELNRERLPLNRDAVAYLRRVGGRLLY